MKKLILCFIVIVLFISCDSDEDNQSTPIISTGNFKIDDDPFQLSQGFITPSEEDEPDLYRKFILLSSDGYSWNQNQFIGAADGAFITLYSDNSSFEVEGTYSITDNQAASGQAEMYFAINYDIQNDTLDNEEEIESGTLTITKNTDGTYIFKIDNAVVDIIGDDFTLDYEGVLTTISP
jgi:hypothetical protein